MGRPALAALTAGLLVVLFVAGLTLANSIGASRVAENAATLHWLNGASSAAALTRAALAQEVTFTGLELRGLTDPEDADFARTEADRAMSVLTSLAETAEGFDGILDEFIAGAERVRAVLAVSGTAPAGQAMSDLEAIYQGLSERLMAEQDTVLAAIAANSEAAAQVDDYLSVLLTLAIPAAAVLVYWAIARRQVRELAERSRIELGAERALSRAKDAFISGLSHELRTPLTSVYGFAEILVERDHEPDQVREMAKEIARESADLARMVDDLIVASRLESTGVAIDLVPTPIDPIVASAMHPFVRSGHEFDWSPDSISATTDGQRLRQVLVNLLSNAVRHGGQKVGVATTESGGAVEIEVWDDGPGIPEEMVKRLHQQRYAHDGEASLISGSLGLGLSVARRLVDRMDGSITYRRREGRTSFIVSLPRVEAAPETVERSWAPVASSAT